MDSTAVTHGSTTYRRNRTRTRKSKTPEYRAWAGMFDRCYQAGHRFWHCYGGRGITVCDRWHTFENFLEDMGERPPGPTRFSLDRLDNERGYSPDNCGWRTHHEQLKNRRHPTKWKVRKLSVPQVHQVKWLVEMGYSQTRVARMYGVTAVMVGLVVRGKARNYSKDTQ